MAGPPRQQHEPGKRRPAPELCWERVSAAPRSEATGRQINRLVGWDHVVIPCFRHSNSNASRHADLRAITLDYLSDG